jgi:hypothetical protein
MVFTAMRKRRSKRQDFVFDSTPLEFSDDEFHDFAWEALICIILASAPC